MKTIIKVSLLTVCLLAWSNVIAQNADLRGKALYNDAKYSDAIQVLSAAVESKEFKTAPDTWSTLGLAYIAVGDFKKAAKTLEKAVSLAPSNSVYRSNLAYAYLALKKYDDAETEASKAIVIDPGKATSYYIRGSNFLAKLELESAQKDAEKAIDLDPGLANGYLLLSEIEKAKLYMLLGKSGDGSVTIRENVGLLTKAAGTLRTGLERSKPGPDRDRIESELSSLDLFVNFFSREPRAPGQPFALDPTETPVRLISKPKPSYPEIARQNNVSGQITLAVVFSGSGKIEGIIPLTRLGYGLEQSAIAATRGIKFEPHQKGGKPVSIVRIITFTFGTY